MNQRNPNPSTTTFNGYDTTAMGATLQAIQEQPVIARFQFRAKNRWLNGGKTRTTISDFDGACQTHVHATPHVLDCDEPHVLLGNDEAPSPAAFALHALAGCLGAALLLHATARGIAIRSVESTLEADADVQGLLGLDPNVRNGFSAIRVGMRVEADADSEVIDELIELACARSPLFDALANPTPIQVHRVR